MFDKDVIVYIAAVLALFFLVGLSTITSFKYVEREESFREAMIEEQKEAKQIAAKNSKKLDMLLDVTTNAVANTERK